MAVEKANQEVVNNHSTDMTNSKQDTTTPDKMDFDDLLSSAGEFGRYQFLLFCSTFPFYFYGVCAYFQQLFLTEVSPNHWCWIPELENLTALERRTLAIPNNDKARFGYSQCQTFDANWTEVLLTGGKPNSSWITKSCEYGWEFNKTEIPYPTISSDLGWVCERDSYQATAQSIFFVGCIVGGLLLGWVADRFGRLPAIVISNIITCVGGVVSIFARNFTEFAVYRFFMGMGYDNCMMMVYLLVLEYVAPKYRTLMANVSFAMFYSTSIVALPWIALACGHWKTIALATSLPMALAIFSPFLIPESPRWLLSKGRVDDAVRKVLLIGRINRKEIPSKLINQFKESVEQTKEEEPKSILELMRRPLLRKVFLYICINYICSSLVFDALVRSIGGLNFNFFISFSLVSATEFPSMILLAFVMDWIGRRWLSTISFLISAIFSIATVFVGSGLLSVICAMIARFMANMAYGAAIQWTAEVLPTPVRGTGVGIVHICGYIGTIISPLIVYLETFVYWLPLVVTGCIAFFATVVAFLLPETAKRDMPHTFDDAEELFRNQKYWSFPSSIKNKEDKGQINDSFEL